nr:hypothetical protein REQ54_04290 [Rhizobium sp. Q54]
MDQWSRRVRDEEHLVVSLQRFANIGVEDQYGKLRETFGENIQAVGGNFIAIAQPWLGLEQRSCSSPPNLGFCNCLTGST